jgi:type IV secretion system protein VirB1
VLPSLDMMHQCAPNVAPATTSAIIQIESGGNPFALGVNGPISKRPHPRSAAEAAQLARFYIAQGYSVDLGLMQINSRNLRGLGYTVEQILDPCNNLRAGSWIISRGYAGAARRFGEGQDALRAALSAYNTGNYEQGFKNGYVAKYYPGKGLRITVRSIPAVLLSETAHSPVKDVFNADSTVYSIWDKEKSSD